MNLVSNTLKKKDIPADGRDRLYYIKLYNDQELFLIGKDIDDCFELEIVKCKVKSFAIINSWKELTRKTKTINSYTNCYNRTIIQMPDLIAYYDEYKEQYFVVKSATNQSIILK